MKHDEFESIMMIYQSANKDIDGNIHVENVSRVV